MTTEIHCQEFHELAMDYRGASFAHAPHAYAALCDYVKDRLTLAASGGNAAPELPSLPSGVAATERMRSYAIEYGKACHAAGRGAAVREYIDNGTFKDVAAPNAALVAACTEGSQVNLPDFMDWLADRLEYVYNESPNVDFVRTCRDRAKKVRAALSAAGQEVKP